MTAETCAESHTEKPFDFAKIFDFANFAWTVYS